MQLHFMVFMNSLRKSLKLVAALSMMIVHDARPLSPCRVRPVTTILLL